MVVVIMAQNETHLESKIPCAFAVPPSKRPGASSPGLGLTTFHQFAGTLHHPIRDAPLLVCLIELRISLNVGHYSVRYGGYLGSIWEAKVERG